MGKYKVGDKVLLEGKVFKIEKDNIPYPYGIRIAENVEFMFGEEEVISKTYEDGLNDAWELARKICGDGNNKENYDGKTIGEIFGGYIHSGLVLDDFTYQQALAKIEAYEKSQQIQVGDVVEFGAGTIGAGTIAVVTRTKEEYIYVCFEDGTSTGFVKDDYVFKKTGRHIDISNLLEQIRGDD